MNDSELNAMIRAARTPERAPEYWESFPGRVIRNLGHRRIEAPARIHWWMPLALGASLALACVAIGFFVGRADPAAAARLLLPERRLCREWKAVPAQLCVMMQDDHGLHRLAAESTE